MVSSSEDSPLSRAVRTCRADDAYSGVPGLLGRGRRRWRKAKAANASRKRVLRDDFFLQTAQALGRRPAEDGRARKRRKGLVDRERCAGSFTDSFVTTLAFPDGELLPKPLEVAASHGVSQESVNRARQVAANVFACEVEEKLTLRGKRLNWEPGGQRFWRRL